MKTRFLMVLALMIGFALSACEDEGESTTYTLKVYKRAKETESLQELKSALGYVFYYDAQEWYPENYLFASVGELTWAGDSARVQPYRTSGTVNAVGSLIINNIWEDDFMLLVVNPADSMTAWKNIVRSEGISDDDKNLIFETYHDQDDYVRNGWRFIDFRTVKGADEP